MDKYALKHDKLKPRTDLIDPEFILSIAEVLRLGAIKYKENSWKQVDDALNRYYGAAMRHLLQWRKGEKLDKETGLSHLTHAACNLMFIMYLERNGENGTDN